MKKIITMLTTLCMVVALAVPAFALEYEIDGPGCEYGEDTSIEVVYTNEPDMNMDVSKNAALVPPAFGSASAYTLNTGYPLTPNLAPGYMTNSGAAVNGSSANVVPPVISGGATSGNTSNTSSYTGAGFTEVTSSLKYSDGSLGTLTIPAIGVNTKIYEGTSTASMAKGAAHFSDTSIWDGNVCLAAHNRGTNAIFGKIHTLTAGDTITLTTKLGTRTYAVVSIEKVQETDTSGTAATSDNQVTLYTCVMNERPYRWCVTAIEIS